MLTLAEHSGFTPVSSALETGVLGMTPQVARQKPYPLYCRGVLGPFGKSLSISLPFPTPVGETEWTPFWGSACSLGDEQRVRMQWGWYFSPALWGSLVGAGRVQGSGTPVLHYPLLPLLVQSSRQWEAPTGPQ